MIIISMYFLIIRFFDKKTFLDCLKLYFLVSIFLEQIIIFYKGFCMKQIFVSIFILSIILFNSCKSNETSNPNNSSIDILTNEYAKQISRNKSKMSEAKIFVSKALDLHKQKKYADALIEWQNALKLYADSEIYYNLGDTLFNLNRLEDAIKAYKIALHLNFAKPQSVYYNLACSYSKQKNKRMGLKYLYLAIRKGYNSYEHIKRDPDLDFLRSQTNIKVFMENAINSPQYYEIKTNIYSGLAEAIEQKNYNKLKELLDNGINPNSIIYYDNEFSYTALMFAAKEGNLKIIELLLDYGADCDFYLNIGAAAPICISALYVAIKHNQVEIIDFLLKQIENILILGEMPLLLAIEKDNFNLIDKLLSAGVSIDGYSHTTTTPLTSALEKHKISIVKLLLDRGANPDRVQAGCCGGTELTPLMVAITSKFDEGIKILLSKNVDINYKNWHGYTALLYAIGQKNAKLAIELINRGAIVKNVVLKMPFNSDINNDSILMFAIRYCPAIVELLIKKGVDVNYKNPDKGTTALSIARENGYHHIVKLLQQTGARE